MYRSKRTSTSYLAGRYPVFPNQTAEWLLRKTNKDMHDHFLVAPWSHAWDPSSSKTPKHSRHTLLFED